MERRYVSERFDGHIIPPHKARRSNRCDATHDVLTMRWLALAVQVVGFPLYSFRFWGVILERKCWGWKAVIGFAECYALWSWNSLPITMYPCIHVSTNSISIAFMFLASWAIITTWKLSWSDRGVHHQASGCSEELRALIEHVCAVSCCSANVSWPLLKTFATSYP